MFVTWRVVLPRLRGLRKRLSIDAAPPPPKDGIILALKKQEGQGLASENAEADANIDVLSLIHKSNVRFTLSHQRGNRQGGDSAADIKDEESDEDRHFAPQHRRYLTYPKVKDAGSPSHREKMDNRLRLDRAVSNAHSYQLEALGLVDQSAGHNALTDYKGLSSSIEDKIQLSILQGDLDNLKGAGRPIDRWENPFVDKTQDLAFEILKRNGVKPEWIESQANQTALNNHLRSRLRVLLISDLLRAKEAASSGGGGGGVSDNAILAAVRADEELCWHYTDLYNLQVPSYTLTRGRISAAYELNQARAALLEAAAPEAEAGPAGPAGAGAGAGAAGTAGPALDSGRLLQLLAEAQRGVDESLSLANRLRSERRGRGSETSSAEPSRQQQQLAAQAQRWLLSASSGAHGAGCAGQHDSLGLTAGALAMRFFMAPVDKVIASFNRLL